jgi:hypothetical protein
VEWETGKVKEKGKARALGREKEMGKEGKMGTRKTEKTGTRRCLVYGILNLKSKRSIPENKRVCRTRVLTLDICFVYG